ncbi:MAG: pseudouridine synthase [Pseudohongiellaceae bacterium]|jgi:23S rRNA pseudouridine2457 synthase
MPQIILFNKPCGVLSQFSGDGSRPTLADYIDQPQFYPAGRLDRDTEGLLLLTNDGKLQERIADPRFGKTKVYLAQVEGELNEDALKKLRAGVRLKDGMTLPADAQAVAAPTLWDRDPPIRFRKHIPTNWLQLSIREGKNRQVRRMTAAVGLPTLRLVRITVDQWQLGDLQPGQWQLLDQP